MFQHYTLLLLQFYHIYRCHTIYINCTGSQRCNNQVLTCSEDEDCFINCNGKFACSHSNIICPQNNAKCSVICKDYLSCSDLTINARNSSLLSITSSGYESLSFARIYCPINLEINSCSIAYFGAENGFNMMNIYTLYSSNIDNIDIECNASAACWSNGNNPILHYGNNLYPQRCTIHNTDHIKCTFDILTTEIAVDTLESSYLSRKMFKLMVSGFVVGALLSFCGCVLGCFGRNIWQKVKLMTIPQMTRNRSTSVKNMSPELQTQISQDIDLNLDNLDMDIMDIDDKISPENNHLSSTVNVTVVRYSHENKDESAANVPFSKCSSIMTDTNHTNFATDANVLEPDTFEHAQESKFNHILQKLKRIKIPKMTRNKSTSLKHISPELQTKISEDVDLNLDTLDMSITNIDALGNNPMSILGNNHPSTVTVTVLSYSHENEDESPANVANSGNLHFAADTNGLASDEFIIRSDTERARELKFNHNATQYV